jgi:hypothetical protein
MIRSLNCGQHGPAKEEVMHPDIIQTIAAERSRSLQEEAAARHRTELIRRPRRTRRPRPFRRVARAGSSLRLRVA